MLKKIINHIIVRPAIMAGCLFLLIFCLAMKDPQPKKMYTYLALGDSYTIGEKVAAEESFPAQVVRQLREQGVNIAAPRIIAKTGWTTGELQVALNKARLKKSYDFVTLLIGVNNQYRGLKIVDYIPEFENLLRQAIRLAGGNTAHVVVLSIPDWGITPFAEGRDRKQITTDIDAYNAANQLLAEKYGVHYINITPATRKAVEDPGLLTEDGLHPSGKAYAEWATEISKYIISKTGKQR